MNSTLLQHFNRLQHDTNTVLRSVAGLSSATYYHVPASGKWSIAQIMTHLLTAERLSVQYMKKKSQGIHALPAVGLPAHLRFFVLRLSQRLPLRFKAPKVVVESTPHMLSYGDMVRQLDATRGELKQLLESLPDEHIRKTIFRHPYAGLLDAAYAVQFMREHLLHHYPQIKAIIRNQKHFKG